MELIVKQAPKIDLEKLRIRINDSDRPKGIEWYDYVQLKLSNKNKSIVCKLHGDDILGINNKQSSLIHINEPLRYKLGINIDDNINATIKKKPFLFAWYYFIRYHPDDIVRVATWLAIIAILISIISFFIAVF